MSIEKVKQYFLALLVPGLLSFSLSSNAAQFCFATASSYYEQVYCELEVKGQSKSLPPFEQFKKNNEVVQFSLLKNLAERNSIKLPAPKKKETISKEIVALPKFKEPVFKEPTFKEKSATQVVEQVKTNARPSSGCEIQSKSIVCGSIQYNLLGNKSNNRLASGVLNESYKMDLPASNGQSTTRYLTAAYEQYIQKMCDIGLAGVTMTFARFSYIYQDLKEKGISFTQRFELMYKFLKKDKATMWISEKLPANQLSISDCDLLSNKYYICASNNQNYIFELR